MRALRITLATLAMMACVGLVAVGGTFVLVGFAEQRHISRAYTVGFIPGDDCDDSYELYVAVEDGEIWDCVPSYIPSGSGRVDLPGFTDSQNEQVEELIEQLSEDRLDEAEQREIQDLVSTLRATIPERDRLYHDQLIWGAGRAWLGVGMAVLGVAGACALFALIGRQLAR